MSPHLRARLRIGLLLFVTVMVQTTLGSDLRIGRVAPDLIVLFAICAGLAGGTEAGAWIGFLSGLWADMFLTSTPVGLSALTYCLIGAVVGALRSTVVQDHPALLPLFGFIGTAAAVVTFVGVGEVFGQGQLVISGRSWLLRVILVESLWNAVLAVPAYFAYSRIARGSAGSDLLGASGGGSASPGVVTK